MGRERGESAHHARDRESHLALAFRPAHRGQSEQLRQHRQEADASRTARLARGDVRGEGLVVQGDAPAHHDARGVSAQRLASRPARCSRRKIRPARATPSSSRAGSPPRNCATRCSPRRANSIPTLGGIPNRPEINLEAALQPRQVMGTFAAAWMPNPLPAAAPSPLALRAEASRPARSVHGGLQRARAGFFLRTARGQHRHAAGLQPVQRPGQPCPRARSGESRA